MPAGAGPLVRYRQRLQVRGRQPRPRSLALNGSRVLSYACRSALRVACPCRAHAHPPPPACCARALPRLAAGRCGGGVGDARGAAAVAVGFVRVVMSGRALRQEEEEEEKEKRGESAKLRQKEELSRRVS